MCSITDPRLAMIGTAIDELAEAARAEAAGTRGGDGRPGTSDTMAERLASIWAMVADLDPGLAQRLSWYTDEGAQHADPQPRDPQHTTHD
jgi:hypothetical protein